MSALLEEINILIEQNRLLMTPTQASLSLPIIARLRRKMELKLLFPPISIAGHAIIDGHHRYVASKLSNQELSKVTSFRTAAKFDFAWSQIDFVNVDWGSPEKAILHNELDAKYNGLTLEQLMAMLS